LLQRLGSPLMQKETVLQNDLTKILVQHYIDNKIDQDNTYQVAETIHYLKLIDEVLLTYT